MIFAETETALPMWVSVLAVLIGGPISAAIGGAVTYLVRERKTQRRDTVEQLYKIIDRLEKQVEDSEKDIKTLSERASRAEVAEAKCQGNVQRLESDIRGMNQDIRRMQERLYDLPPGVTRPCTVIASLPDGTIYNVSAEAGSLFHWIPGDLIGKNIEVLMPRDLRPVHRRKMEMLIKENRDADPSHAVLTFGVTSEGKRFPITVNLSGPWEGKDKIKYINADIRRRGDSDFHLPIHPLPDDPPGDEGQKDS